MFRPKIFASLTVMVLTLLPAAALAGKVALVIGMAAYQHVTPLKNTLNDARAIAEKLKEIGFQVTIVTDKPRAELVAVMRDFSFRAETADLALIYYAGHGVEVSGFNYLIPIDAEVHKVTDIPRVGISLTDLLKVVQGARQMRVVILDSCRNNPFGNVAGLGERGLTNVSGNAPDPADTPQGLAPVNPQLGTLVAYANVAGRTAIDGTGENSPYATALVNNLGTPDLEIGLMFRKVRDEVLLATDNLQEPFQYGSLPATPFNLGGTSGANAVGSITAIAAADPIKAWSEGPRDQEPAMRNLADTGDTRQMIGLAYIRLNPDDSRYNLTEAVQLMTKAADLGSAEAQFELGRLYEVGIGVKADPAKAVALYQQSAAAGFDKAINNMGFLYYQGGLGVQRDQARGLALFGQAAELRNPEALYNYAALIDDGKVKGMGAAESAHYLYQSLRAGSEGALTQLTAKPSNFSRQTRIGLQREMRDHGFYDGPLDGRFRASMVQAMKHAFGLIG